MTSDRERLGTNLRGAFGLAERDEEESCSVESISEV